MGWPSKETPELLHWIHKEPNALGQPQAACRVEASFYRQPKLTKRPHEVTCGKCEVYVRSYQ